MSPSPRLAVIRDLLADQRGVVAPMTGAIFAVLLGMVGLVTDAGVWFTARRDLQSATDAAALGSARFAPDGVAAVTSRAQELLIDNGREGDDLVSAQVGFYCPNDTGAAQFQSVRCAGDEATAPMNAVALATQGAGSIIFSRLFTDASVTSRPISVTSTAALVNEAGLRAGTGLLNVNVAQSFLRALLGGNVTILSYQGLANADINALSLLDAIAVQNGLTVGTYDQLLDETVSVGSILQAGASVLGQHSQVAGASAVTDLGSIRAALQGNPQVRLGDLFDLGVWQELPVGSSATSPAALSAGVSAYQLATAALQLANGSNFLNLNLSTIPSPISGLASLGLSAAAIEKPQEPPFGFGPEGSTVHTAQVRLQMNLSLLSSAIQLPLYAEAASGTATIQDINCDDAPYSGTEPTTASSSATSVTVRATTAASRIAIGQGNLATGGPATSGDISGLKVSVFGMGLVDVDVEGYSNIDVATGSSDLVFNRPTTNWTALPSSFDTTTGVIGRPATDTDSGSLAIPARTAAGEVNLLSGLVGGLTITKSCVTVLGVPVCIPLGTILSTLTPALAAVDALVSPAINRVLSALGAQLGYMDVFVTGARCGIPVLVE